VQDFPETGHSSFYWKWIVGQVTANLTGIRNILGIGGISLVPALLQMKPSQFSTSHQVRGLGAPGIR
jgi:hypothetical protein